VKVKYGRERGERKIKTTTEILEDYGDQVRHTVPVNCPASAQGTVAPLL
jgi:hypothetical protein